MSQLPPGRFDQIALLAEHLPILKDLTRVREIFIIRRELGRRRASAVRIETGALSFLGPKEIIRVDELPCEHGVLKPALIWPYLQWLTGAHQGNLTLNHEQLTRLGNDEVHRLADSAELRELVRLLAELEAPTVLNQLGDQEPVKPTGTVPKRVDVATPPGVAKVADVQGTLFGDLS